MSGQDKDAQTPRRPALHCFCRALLFILLPFVFAVEAHANTPPVANDDNYTVHKRLEVGWQGYLSNDYDPDDPNKYALRLQGGNGGRYTTQWGYINLYLGSFTYTAPTGFVGQDSYRYTICDSSNACASATIYFNVVNSPPVAVNDNYTVHRRFEIPSGRGFLANDSDPDGDPVNLKTGTNGCRSTGNGSLCLYNGPLTYTPNYGFVGQDSYAFQVCDDLGACTNETVYFNVTNSPPSPIADVYTARSRIDVPAPGVLGNDGGDPEGDAKTFKIHGLPVSGAGTNATTAYGTVNLYADGRLNYTPISGFTGVDYVQYTVCDDLGACGAATIYFFVPGGCSCVSCGPMDSGGGSGSGPSAGDPVNLVSGRESYTPAPDMTVYNPDGPGVVWKREYHGFRGMAGYGSPGLSLGWAHPYDVTIQGTPGSWGALTLVYPNGKEETLAPALDAGGQPTGVFTTPAGEPYLASGVPGATAGQWQSITITWKDGTQWRLTPFSGGIYALGQITNKVGRSINFTWRGDRALSQISDATSGAALLTFAYDGNAKLSSVTDAYGRRVAYSFSVPSGTDPGRLMSVSQVVAAGTNNPPSRWTYSYSSAAHQQLTGITVPSPTGSGVSTAAINYDANGKVASLVDANGNQRVYTYGSGSTQVQVKDAAGNVAASWTQKFNASGRDTGVTDANNKSTLIEYGDAQNPTKPTRIVDKNGKATTFTYDQRGNVLTVTTPRNVTTTYTYNYTTFALGRLTSVQEGSKPATTFTYFEPGGLLKDIISPAPNNAAATTTTSYTYDNMGNVLTVTGPGNNAASQIVTSFNYTADGAYTQPAKVGQPLTVSDNLGHATHYRYDAQGRVTSIKDALGHETNPAYNLAGQPTTIEFPATGQTGAGRGRKVNSYLYTGGPLTTVTVYDESGAQARQVAYGYGAEGETKSIAGSAEPATQTYDALYRLKTLKDGNNNTTVYNYDGVGHLTSVQMPGGESVQFPSHDFEGRPLQRIDANGVVTNYLYDDPENQLTDIQYPSSPSLNVHFGYDSFGRRNAMTDGTGSHSYAYGNLDELLGVTTTYAGLPAQAISYAYYPNGSRQTMGTPAGTFAYEHDGAGRMAGLTNPHNETTAWSYDDNDWLRTQQLANGALATYTYNARGQTTRLLNEVGGATLSDFNSLTYDGAGNRTTLTATLPQAPTLSGLTGYQYDAKDQLKQEQTTRNGGLTDTFDYDPAGNPVSFKGISKSYNANNQQTGTGFSHDANGNPTTYNNTALAFDAENRLTSFGSVMSAGYRGDGLRAWKQTQTGRTYFLYDGITPVVELDATGAVTATHTFGAAGLVSRRAGGASAFYTFDPQGNVSERLDAAGGALSTYAFTAHGAALTPLTSSDPYGYKARFGYYTDHETGLLLLTHRYYDPQSGRFLTRDPISYQGGINLYGYVKNNPANWADPVGLYPSISINDFGNPYEDGRLIPSSQAGWWAWLKREYGWLGRGDVWEEFWTAKERSKLPCKPVGERFSENFIETNQSIPGMGAPSIIPGLLGTGNITGGKLAQIAGEPSNLRWANNWFGPTGSASRGPLLRGAVTRGGLNAAAGAAAFETGVAIGSLINAATCPCSESSPK